jgi:hypothetical protein
MSRASLQSPWTGDHWDDARPAVGTLAGLAVALNEQRPRRRPPPDVAAAIVEAVAAAGIFAGLPKISKTGIEGTQASDAYWKAKDARFVLKKFIGESFMYNYNRCYLIEDEFCLAMIVDPETTLGVVQQIAARLAYLSAAFTELGSVGMPNDLLWDRVEPSLRVAAVLIQQSGIARDEAASIERHWQFACAAGRSPTAADADLLAAFEATLMAGCSDFARHLARYGYGVASSQH